jgi:hypothetical protein
MFEKFESMSLLWCILMNEFKDDYNAYKPSRETCKHVYVHHHVSCFLNPFLSNWILTQNKFNKTNVNKV